MYLCYVLSFRIGLCISMMRAYMHKTRISSWCIDHGNVSRRDEETKGCVRRGEISHGFAGHFSRSFILEQAPTKVYMIPGNSALPVIR